MDTHILHLSNSELVSKLGALVKQEAEVTLEVLKHLAEFDRRKGYLELGYQSLFVYVTQRLRYSEPAANRRIKAARCIREFPVVLELLVRQSVNLSTICLFAPLLTGENQKELLEKVSGKPKVEVERVVASYQDPRRADVREVIKPIMIAAQASKAKSAAVEGRLRMEQGFANHRLGDGGNDWAFLGSERESAAPIPVAAPVIVTPSTPPVIEERTKFTFSGSTAFADKVQRMRELLSGKYPKGACLEEVFNEAMEWFIKAHDPVLRAEKRAAKARARSRGTVVSPPSAETGESGAKENKSSRHIPRDVRDQVMLRDKGRCTYVGPDGRCSSKWDEEVHHIVPSGLGGKSVADNLTVRCARHNLHAAIEDYGPSFMARFLKAGKEASTPSCPT
jgi:5-methylcytosine-specific restriction endonuclease McrA